MAAAYEGLAVSIAVVFAFDFFNGFHDVTNAIAGTIGKGIVDTSVYGGTLVHAMSIIMGGVLGAIAWDLITWWWGLPTSSSHALIGGLIGATLLAGGPGAVILPAWENTLLFLALTGTAFGIGVAIYAVILWRRKERLTAGALLLAGLFSGLLPALA